MIKINRLNLFILSCSILLTLPIMARDRYSAKTYAIKKGDTLDTLVTKNFTQKRVGDPVYRKLYKERLKQWNRHIKDWKKLTPRSVIYTSSPYSPFVDFFGTPPIPKWEELDFWQRYEMSLAYEVFTGITMYNISDEFLRKGTLESSYSAQSIGGTINMKSLNRLTTFLDLKYTTMQGLVSAGAQLSSLHTFDFGLGGKIIKWSGMWQPFAMLQREQFSYVSIDKTITELDPITIQGVQGTKSTMYWVNFGTFINFYNDKAVARLWVAQSLSGSTQLVDGSFEEDLSGVKYGGNVKYLLNKDQRFNGRLWVNGFAQYAILSGAFNTTALSLGSNLSYSF